MRYFIVILLSINLVGCQGDSMEKEYKTQLNKVYSVGFNDDYSYVSYSPDSSRVFVFSSLFAHGLRYKVACQALSATYPTVSLDKAGRAISFAWADKYKYCIVENNFDANTLAKSLLISSDGGKNWSVINTPVTLPRTGFFMGDSSLIVEGDQDGMVQIHVSNDNGKEWKRILVEKEYKRAFLLSQIDSERVLCLVSKTLDVDVSNIMVFNVKDEKFTDLLEVKNATFKLPISINKNLYCICGDQKIIVFKINGMKYEEVEVLPIPHNIDLVENVYLNEGVSIITGSSYDVGEENKSWISFNKGDKWEPFFQDKKIRLVNNNGNRLLVEDSANDIYECKLSW